MNSYDSDSDEDYQFQNEPGISTQQIQDQDPERAARIQQMVNANAGHFDVLQDDQVTDFVLRMAEKNQRMMDQATDAAQQHNNGTYTISSDSDEEMGDDLETSYGSKRQSRSRATNHSVPHKLNYDSQNGDPNNSPDEYPPGEAYAGDEDELGDEIPSYDPKGDDMISYGRLCCIACALVILMLLTSILILVFVILADDAENAHKSHEFEGMVLPVAPFNLPQLCDMDALQNGGMQSLIDCREPCMKAACCWEVNHNNNNGDSNDGPVCWESHPLECTPYEVCTNLLHVKSEDDTVNNNNNNPSPSPQVPKASEGVMACDPNGVDSVEQVLMCEDACSYATCCWKSDAADKCHSHPNCGGYRACNILNAGNQEEEDASASGSGGATNNDNSNSNGGTTTTSPPIATFAPVVVPTPVVNLDQVCSQESTMDACREYCHEATCCWKMATMTFIGADGEQVSQSVLGTCSHQAECEAYTACANLPKSGSHGLTDEIPSPGKDLDAVCANSLDGDCRNTCNQAMCCWKPAVSSFTGPDGATVMQKIQGSCSHKGECSSYQACTQLPEATMEAVNQAAGDTYVIENTPTNNDIPQAPNNLDEVCESQDSVCESVCNEAVCCWKTATTVFEGDNGKPVAESIQGSCSYHPKCDAYKPCKGLPGAEASHGEIEVAPTNLDDVCRHSPVLCRETCEQATCCWKTATTSYEGKNGETITESKQAPCAHKEECAGYTSCAVLQDDVYSPGTPSTTTSAPGTSSPAPAPSASGGQSSGGFQGGGSMTEFSESTIYDACYNHIDQPGAEKTLCETVCEPGACCFNLDTGCDEGFECTKYEPCAKLAQNVDGGGSAVDEACANKDDLAECVRLCAQVTCCYTNDLSKSCDITNPGVVCSEYTACEVIYEGVQSNNGGGR